MNLFLGEPSGKKRFYTKHEFLFMISSLNKRKINGFIKG